MKTKYTLEPGAWQTGEDERPLQKLPAVVMPDGSKILLLAFDPCWKRYRYKLKGGNETRPTLDTRNEAAQLLCDILNARQAKQPKSCRPVIAERFGEEWDAGNLDDASVLILHAAKMERLARQAMRLLLNPDASGFDADALTIELQRELNP